MFKGRGAKGYFLQTEGQKGVCAMVRGISTSGPGGAGKGKEETTVGFGLIGKRMANELRGTAKGLRGPGKVADYGQRMLYNWNVGEVTSFSVGEAKVKETRFWFFSWSSGERGQKTQGRGKQAWSAGVETLQAFIREGAAFGTLLFGLWESSGAFVLTPLIGKGRQQGQS